VNPTTNKIYVVNTGNYPTPGTATAIDGATNTTTTVPAGVGAILVALNPVTNRIYVANSPSSGLGTITVIDESQAQPNPLTTSITPLPGNQTDNPLPTFTFTALSATPAQPDNVFFQLDTWQNTWTTASGNDPSFSGALASLQPGLHILYAYATDGQEATSTQLGSPLIGAIQAYGFLVTPPPPVVVTVGTDVLDASFAVDGQSYTSTQAFPWVVGSSHMIATTSPQTGPAGKAFVFTQWSDGDTAISRTVTAPSMPTSFTAKFRVLLSQTITFTAIPTQLVGTSATLSATATSGLPVTFSSATPAVCTVSQNSATFVAAATCTIRASQFGDSAFAPAPPVSQSFGVLF
jgi:hypothetical protein